MRRCTTTPFALFQSFTTCAWTRAMSGTKPKSAKRRTKTNACAGERRANSARSFAQASFGLWFTMGACRRDDGGATHLPSCGALQWDHWQGFCLGLRATPLSNGWRRGDGSRAWVRRCGRLCVGVGGGHYPTSCLFCFSFPFFPFRGGKAARVAAWTAPAGSPSLFP